MNYTFHQLRVFLKVAELGSVTRAAEALHLTQPAVSSQLKLLQSQVDVPLTEIIGRRIHITEPGRELESLAKEILQKAEELDERMRLKDGRISGKLRLSVVSTGKYFVPPILAEFHRRFPEVSITLDVSNRRETERSILEYDADFAIASQALMESEYEQVPFLPNPLVLVCPRKSFDFQVPEGKVSSKQLKNMPFIFRESGSGTRARMEEFLDAEGIDPVVRMELVTNEAVKQLILAGFGISLLSVYSLRLELKHRELRLINHPRLPIHSSWKLVWLKGKRHTPATEAFLRFVQNESHSWVDKLFPWVKKHCEVKSL
jgi:DNA-binding transcriptional LysR family regulator